ncbi:glycosyltransferase family 4 protein [bacterium]|nr:glycosyltransferase family 4 protein [bacterium]
MSERRSEKILVLYSWDRLWSLGPGSGSPDFHLSLSALGEAFARVTVVHPAGAGCLASELPPGVEAVSFPWPERIFSFSRLAGCSWLRRPAFALDWLLRLATYWLFNYKARRTARRVASTDNYTLVAAYGFMGVRAAESIARSLGAPLIVRLFGVSLGLKGWSRLVRLAQFEEVLSFRCAAARWVVTQDGSGGAAAAARLGVPPERVVSLLCGVERPSATAQSPDRAQYRTGLGLPADCRVVLRVCRLWVQQRVERLIEALPRSLPDGAPVAAVLVGDGPERERLERLATHQGKRVLFTGALTQAELVVHYQCADLYAATADRTNLTNSVLEALCHGLPVLALEVGEVGKVVRDGVNGRLVAWNGPAGLESALTGLLADSHRLAILAEGARRTAAELIPDFAGRKRREVEAFSLEE